MPKQHKIVPKLSIVAKESPSPKVAESSSAKTDKRETSHIEIDSQQRRAQEYYQRMEENNFSLEH